MRIHHLDSRIFIVPPRAASSEHFMLSGAYESEDGSHRPYDFSLALVADGYRVRVAAGVGDERDEWGVIATTSHSIDSAFAFRGRREVRADLRRSRPYDPWTVRCDDGRFDAELLVRGVDVSEQMYGGPAPFHRYVERFVATLPTRGQTFLRFL